MRIWSVLIISLLAIGASMATAGETNHPNIVLIVADDLGYSDLGCYGGEIATPNLDGLAKDGLRFTQFYNTARCWPSRAAILTGYYAQQIRRDIVPGIPSGTAGVRPPWARLLPALLQQAGYHSYHSGKWHLDGRPLQNGFEHSYSLNDHDRYFYPELHTEDDVPLPAVDKSSGYYATTAIADHAIKYLKEHGTKHSGEPFFAFVAFTSPHFPLQAPPADIAHYHDRYLKGWDVLREERWGRMHSMGIAGSSLSAMEREVGPPYDFPDALKLLGRNEVSRGVPWDTLNQPQRRFQADKMAVHAAMVDRMDREIGRIADQLRSMGAYENTLVMFLSDNGASAEMMVRGDGHNPDAECGTGATFLSIGPGWSSLANTPFRRHKTWVHEGGISTPFIAHWPNGIQGHGELRSAPCHVIDLVPTLLETAGIDRPIGWWRMPVPPLPGKSFTPLLAQDVPLERESLWWQHEGNRALRSGQWKIVAAGAEAPWELYDLSSDRSEAQNLASAQPEKVRALAAEWNRQTQKYYTDALSGLPDAYPGWKHAAWFHLLTTPEGANLPADLTLTNFPVLVRLHSDFFDFSQAKPGGEDIRFTTDAGLPLVYQIDDWQPVKGEASIWVKVPEIKGDRERGLIMKWGKPEATSESSGHAVFGTGNGYLSVWHMSEPVADEVGTLVSTDTGTTPKLGAVGMARHFVEGKGIFGGDRITNYPSGSAPHSTEAWIRMEKPNTTVLGWGNEGGGRGSKIRMQLRSPPHLHIDSDFSDVRGKSRISPGEWTHVAHTYDGTSGKVYINGELDGAASPKLNIKTPARLWIGGWYDNYDFAGDIDEVRISKVTRSAEWIRLEYENQKPLQTLVGPLVQMGTNFSVSPGRISVKEGQEVEVTAEAGQAIKLYWILVRGGRETVVAVDRFRFRFAAGRVTGNESAALKLCAVFPDRVKTLEVPIEIQEGIPDPIVRLSAPGRWDGRSPLVLQPRIENAQALAAAGGTNLHYSWSVSNLAVIQEITPGKLTLSRAQNSGKLVVSVAVDNGARPTVQSVSLDVKEPKSDPWVTRTPAADEKPSDNQFYARDDHNEGTLYWNGVMQEDADSVKLVICAYDHICYTTQVKTGKGLAYRFSAPLKAGMVLYRADLVIEKKGVIRIIQTVTNLICGDAYLLDGQSNAVATDWGEDNPTFSSIWIRTFGSMSGDPEGLKLWGNATHRNGDGEKLQIGYWAMELGRRLVESNQIPVCFINGAVGGTRIDQHQRNPSNPIDRETIYGRLLWRIREARLTHGIRGAFWHQGENDQGADGPTGRFGYETYRQLFIEMAGAWKQDYPNIQHYYIFQIWPKSCAMGIDGSDNRLREVQRRLPEGFSRMSIMSTLGVRPGGECHYPSAGYARIAELVFPQVEKYNYGKISRESISPPDLTRAYYPAGMRDRITLEFDQPVKWDDSVASNFYLDGGKIEFVGGQVSGRKLTLLLPHESTARTITYLDGSKWNPNHLLWGENGIAALTFCEVPIGHE